MSDYVYVLDILDEKGHGGHSIEVKCTAPGVYTIIDNSLVDQHGSPMVDDTHLGFCEWDDCVENLDTDSISFEWCNISVRVKWMDVVICLETDECYAPSLGRLMQALCHITFCAFCPGDMY